MATQSPGDSIAIGSEQRSGAMSLVVCSLEPWGEVRRRIRILVDEIIELEPCLHVLYVSPAVDIPHQLRQGRSVRPEARLEQVHSRVHVLRPRKWLPRALGPFADRSLERQVLDTVDQLGLHAPLLWINDAAYAGLTLRTGWPSLYDITDDWLLAPLAGRQRTRLEANEELLLAHSGAVVVCSPDLVRTRGRHRTVELIPNGVDVEMFRRPQARPADLPPAPVALYVGTLHAERIDVPLVVALAHARPDVQVVLVGPSSLPAGPLADLQAVPNIHLLGARPYDTIPAYLQHAEVVVIPHLVNPFTESLDPIKAYECLAAGRPTVATPVAGFRELGPPVAIADGDDFITAVSEALSGTPAVYDNLPVPSWHERAESMVSLMHRVRDSRAAS